MKTEEVSASAFQADCLKLIAEIEKGRGSVTITKRGRPVAVLGPVPKPAKGNGLFGAMKGSVLRYDHPTEPAIDPEEWSANR